MLKAWGLIILIGLSCCAWAQENWEKAAELRRNDEFGKAEKLLKDYSSPANFDSLSAPDKIKFLRGLLELAHLKALQDDVAGSLALLNWAEARTDGYQRSIACIKYGEILLDLGEFERASAYLTNADEIIAKRVIDSGAGAAIGQGGEQMDTGAAWRELRDQSDALKAEIEAEQMKVKFGATYGSYVKLRRLQNLIKRSKTPRYRNEALKVADEIIETDPASQFAAAAGYLKGEIMASRLTENSPKKEIAEVKTYLNSFVKALPDGLYRGEALMLLGKISLEIEWNAKEAEKYYTQSLDYFRKAREKRDALSLYAAINDDLKNQTQPTQKPTSLNQWKRIIYHDEDPLKLYNIGNAPTWYVDDKEKNSLFVLGFLSFSNGKYEEAGKFWTNGFQLDQDILGLEAIDWPNASKRLAEAIKHQKMAWSKEEKNLIKNQSNLTQIQLAEFYYLLERFGDMETILRRIILDSKAGKEEKAIAFMGLGMFQDLTNVDEKKLDVAVNYFKQARRLGEKTVIEEAAWFRLIRYYSNVQKYQSLATEEQDAYFKKFPQGKYIPELLYFSVFGIAANVNNHSPKAAAKLQQVFNRMKRDFATSPYTLDLEKLIKEKQQHNIQNSGSKK
jgi:tetratricopeptide (TPR) repeat protein